MPRNFSKIISIRVAPKKRVHANQELLNKKRAVKIYE